MKAVSRGLIWIVKNIEEIVAGAAIIVMVGITSVNVLCRYIFRNPIHWAEELAVICLVWLTFAGIAACYKHNSHLGMDFLIQRLPIKARRVVQQCMCILMLAFFIFITALSISFALGAEKTTPYFHLSYFYLYIAPALGFLSMAIYAVRFFIMSFRNPEEYDRFFVNPSVSEEEEAEN